MATTADSLSAPPRNPKSPTRQKHRQQPPVYELRAERLVLTDAAGNERITLGVDPDGCAHFSMRDGAGNILADVAVMECGTAAHVVVKSANGLGTAIMNSVAYTGTGAAKVGVEWNNEEKSVDLYVSDSFQEIHFCDDGDVKASCDGKAVSE